MYRVTTTITIKKKNTVVDLVPTVLDIFFAFDYLLRSKQSHHCDTKKFWGEMEMIKYAKKLIIMT